MVTPSMRGLDANSWLENEGPRIVASIGVKESQLRQIMDEYIAKLPNDAMLAGLALCVGGQNLHNESTSVQVTTIGIEGRAAMSSFISGDWATVTRVGVVLINNSFQASDRTKHRMDDPHLITIFQDGVDMLMTVAQSAYSDSGYMMAFECDRSPCGTNLEFQSARDRRCPDTISSPKCNYCGKLEDSSTGTSLMMCSRCKLVKYCSKDCQKREWKYHKKTCPK